MKKLFIDIETYNGKTDLRTRGLYRYAEDAEITLVGYAIDDGPAKVWDVTLDTSVPADLFDLAYRHEKDTYQIIAHNAAFERTVFGHQKSEGIYKILANQDSWHCTMAQALAHGLPGGLPYLSDIFKLPSDKAKDPEGRLLVNLFCKPRDGKRASRSAHPAEWEKFREYCRRDVEAERALYLKLPAWNCSQSELDIVNLDYEINSRGFRVDVELAEAAVAIVKKEKQTRDNKAFELTGGRVTSGTQRDRMLEHILKEYGVALPDMAESTLTRRIEDPDLPTAVKELIALRLASAGTSAKKYQALLDSVSSDGRLRGTLQYCGASRTGRWTGRIFQPQNLPRPSFGNDEIDAGIKAIKAGSAEYIYDDVTAMASSALRGVIVAPEGKKLAVADLASIEGRVLAWLAGEDWKVKAYADFDNGAGYDMYTRTYARIVNKDPAEVTKKERQLGKVLELALGYGGGVGAFSTFADAYHIDLSELAADMPQYAMADRHNAKELWDKAVERGETCGLEMKTYIACDCVKRMWRRANPATCGFWADVENAALSAINDAGANSCRKWGKLEFSRVEKNWLRILLPSGRYLCYAGAKSDGGKIRYLGSDTYTRRWGYLSTYGGKLAENIVQAVSRDILAHGMVKAEAEGFRAVLSIHDELITEVPDDGKYSSGRLSQLMSSAPSWAEGLPLAAAGFEAERYRKD